MDEQWWWKTTYDVKNLNDNTDAQSHTHQPFYVQYKLKLWFALTFLSHKYILKTLVTNSCWCWTSYEGDLSSCFKQDLNDSQPSVFA